MKPVELLIWGLSVLTNSRIFLSKINNDESVELNLSNARQLFRDVASSSSSNQGGIIETHPHRINSSQFKTLLQRLDMLPLLSENQDEIFNNLVGGDVHDTLLLSLDDFVTWYNNTYSQAHPEPLCSSVLLGRRTSHTFANTPIPSSVLHDAIQCAISAPNHHLTEPWRFRNLGPVTLKRLLLTDPMNIVSTMESYNDDGNIDSMQLLCQSVAKKLNKWSTIPGWCVVTSKRSLLTDEYQRKLEEEEDFAATCCAVQNMMLFLWSRGIGTKWTSGPIMRSAAFAQVCDYDSSKEKFVGCIWYGYVQGGIDQAPQVPRKNQVKHVLLKLE